MKTAAIIKQFDSKLGTLCERLDATGQRKVLQRLLPRALDRLFPESSVERVLLSRILNDTFEVRRLDPIDHQDLEDLIDRLDTSGIGPDETGEIRQDRLSFRRARLAMAVRFATRLTDDDAFANALYELAYSTEDIDGFLSEAATVVDHVSIERTG